MTGKDELVAKLKQLRAIEQFMLTNYKDTTEKIKEKDFKDTFDRVIEDEKKHYAIVDGIIKRLEKNAA